MNFRHISRLIGSLLVCGGVAVVAAQTPRQTPEQRGREIAATMDRWDSGFEDYQATMEMLLRDRRGGESRRNLRIRVREVDKYRYRHLREERCGEWTCDVLERVPMVAGSGYGRQVVWVDREALRVPRIGYYDRRDTPLKTLEMTGYRECLGHYWRPDRMDMVNHQTGKRTILSWSDYRFRTGLATRDFDARRLQRIR